MGEKPEPNEKDGWITHTFTRVGPMKFYIWGDEVREGEYQEDGPIKWRDEPLSESERMEVINRSFRPFNIQREG